MDEISNKTLAILLIGAIVISLGGTLISLNRLARVRIPLITGLIADEATVNLTIGTLTQVNWTTFDLDWGSGTVVQGKATCKLHTLNDTLDAINCTGFEADAGGPLVLENVGNKNVVLNISTGKTAADFISGYNPVYQWNASDIEPGSCVNVTTVTYVLGDWQAGSATHTTVCDVFYASENADTMQFDVMIVIPSNATAGDKTDIITATIIAI